MDYRKKYNEAQERAKTVMENSYHQETKTACVEIFPELRESDDEKIIRDIHDLLVNACEADRRYPKLLAWLEKQKWYKSSFLNLSIEDIETIKTALRESGLEFTSNREVYDKLEKIPDSAYYLSTVDRSRLYPDGTIMRHTIGYLEKQKEQKREEEQT